MNTIKALLKAIDIVGGQAALARFCGVSQPSVNKWLHKSRYVPAERVLDIERATKGKVTRYQLRPDIYPPEEYRREGKSSST